MVTRHRSGRVVGLSPAHGLLLAVGLIAIVLAACGGSGAVLSTVGSAVGGSTGSGAQPAASAASGEQYTGDGKGAPVPAQPLAGGGSGGTPPTAPKDEARIVRTGSLDLQVSELDPAVARAHDAIVALGGYVGQSRETNDGDRSTATVTYRIPVDRWDDARTRLRGLATKVVGEQTDAIEVTGQLIDLGARIDNLRASEKALQAILEKATKVQDILDVEGRLSDVRGQIEQLDAQRAHLADQAALGTLSVTFRLPIVAVVEAQKSWNPGDEIDRATASLVALLQAGAGAGIWLAIVWIPALLFLAIVLGIAVFVARRLGIRPRVGGPGVAGSEPA
jgi:Domain of unknown function (DUF4349)